jgi:small subunit ribosomal protein S21
LATVQLRPGESQDSLLRRFRKEVFEAGIMSDVRKRRWHVSKSQIRRLEKQKAIRRERRKQRKRDRQFQSD